MARIKILIPEKSLAKVTVPVRITDINYGNHLGNDSLVSIIHEARALWLKSFGYTEVSVEGVGMIMADLSVEFKNESFYGDELIITIYIGEISSVSFDLYYSISNQENKLIAKAKTGMVCYNYDQKKVVAIPDTFKLIL